MILQIRRIRQQVSVCADGPLGFQSLQLPSLGNQHVRGARIPAARHRHTWEGTVRGFLSVFCSRVLVRQSPSQGNEFMPEDYLGNRTEETPPSPTLLFIPLQVATNRAGMSLGASGAVLAILGVFGTAMPDARLQIIFLPMITFTASIGIKSLVWQGCRKNNISFCSFCLSICLFHQSAL